MFKSFSRASSKAQSDYSRSDRECLDYNLTLKRWDKRLTNREFILIDGRKSLIRLLNVIIGSKNQKLLRWVMQLSDSGFTF